MAAPGEAVKANPKKRPRVAQEKRGGSLVPPTATGKAAAPRRNAGEVVMYLLIFGLVSVLFLNFMGVIEIPFLQFLRPGEKTASSQTQPPSDVVPSSSEEKMALYQGPQLEAVGTPEVSPSPEKAETEGAALAQETADGVEVVVGSEQVPEASQVQKNSSLSTPEGESGGVGVTPENMYRMAKIYSAMEPQEAVQILEKFSDEEVVMVLSVMKERQVAEILKAFPVERAVEIARKMMKGR